MEQETVTERIKLLVEKSAAKPADFAKTTGLTNQNVYDLTSGRKGGPSFSSLKKILIALPEVSERWLLLGEGEMLKPTKSPKKIFVTPDLPIPNSNPGTSGGFSEHEPAHKARPAEPLQLVEKQRLSLRQNSALRDQPPTTVATGDDSHYQTQVQSHAVLADVKVIALRYVSFEARTSFFEGLRQNLISDDFEAVPHRLPSTMTEADYADAVVFEIEERTMEPSLRYGQQIIAWPVAESKWGYLHNTICIVAYDETVAVKAIRTNELFDRDGLTLHATSGAGGSFTVARKNIHSIWEANEFYGYVPVLLLS